MDKNHLVSKLDKSLPGAVLEMRRFGRSDMPSIWIEAQSIYQISKTLKEDSEFSFDWLENLSVVEFEKALVISYFLQSYSKNHFLVVRASVVPPSEQAEVCLSSVRSLWPMAEPMEKEIQEMFGIRFSGLEMASSLLAPGWKGFPLRKNYTFPKEYFGISHQYPLNQTSSRTRSRSTPKKGPQ